MDTKKKIKNINSLFLISKSRPRFYSVESKEVYQVNVKKTYLLQIKIKIVNTYKLRIHKSNQSKLYGNPLSKDKKNIKKYF